MDRRGFMVTLLGGLAATAIDQERLIWTHGKKLISVPKTVRVPQRYFYAVTYPLGHDGRALAEMEDRYLKPALLALKQQVDKQALRNMKTPQFVKPKMLSDLGADNCCVGPLWKLPLARKLRAFDGREWVGRIDCEVRI